MNEMNGHDDGQALVMTTSSAKRQPALTVAVAVAVMPAPSLV